MLNEIDPNYLRELLVSPKQSERSIAGKKSLFGPKIDSKVILEFLDRQQEVNRALVQAVVALENQIAKGEQSTSNQLTSITDKFVSITHGHEKTVKDLKSACTEIENQERRVAEVSSELDATIAKFSSEIENQERRVAEVSSELDATIAKFSSEINRLIDSINQEAHDRKRLAQVLAQYLSIYSMEIGRLAARASEID